MRQNTQTGFGRLMDWFNNRDAKPQALKVGDRIIYRLDGKDRAALICEIEGTIISQASARIAYIDSGRVGEAHLFSLKKDTDFQPTGHEFVAGDVKRFIDDINQDLKSATDIDGSGCDVSVSVKRTKDDQSGSDVHFNKAGENPILLTRIRGEEKISDVFTFNTLSGLEEVRRIIDQGLWGRLSPARAKYSQSKKEKSFALFYKENRRKCASQTNTLTQ